MDAVNYSNFRENLKAYCDKVSETQCAYIVTRKANQGNVVILSIEEYNALLKAKEEADTIIKQTFQHRSLEERLADYGGHIDAVSLDWGEPKGKELL